MTDYNKDLKIKNFSEISTDYKASLELSPTGDLVLCDGHVKLCEEILHAVVNDNTKGVFSLNISKTSQREITSMLTLIMRNFRQAQIDMLNRYDPDFTGFYLYRKAAGSNGDYVKVSDNPIDWRYIDTDVQNETEYSYGVTKISKNVFESPINDKMVVKPTRFTNTQEILIGQNIVAIPGNRQVTFYVDGLRYFKRSELLNKILSISATQTNYEPRAWTVQVYAEDFLGDNVAVAATRANVSK